MSYQVHNFQTGEIIEAAPINEMDEQIRKNSEEKIDVSKIGVANGVAGLDNSGKVPLSQLPVSESDIIEGYYYNNKFYEDSSHTTEIAAERRKIYIDLPTNETYRWNGESYVVTSSDTSGKADKVQNATEGNFAGLDANGNLTDSGKKPSDFLTEHQDISGKVDKNQGTSNVGKFMKVGADGELTPENVPDPTNKADKVTNATAGNFAGLDATGNLTDSGKKPSDFLTEHQDISGKVDKNQGTENAGKALGINNQGQVVPVPFSGEDFTGATPASPGEHGYVPAPQTTDTEKFLCGDGTWADVAGGKLVTFELDEVTGTGGSYGNITYISSVSQNMKPVLIEVSNPDAFLDTITVSCMDGGIALSCNNVNGTSTVTVSCLFKANPDSITSSEFDVLANRIGTLGNLQTSEKSNLVGAVNELSDGIAQVQDGLAIVANGNTHAAISSGQFVYVKNHDILAEGLYKATGAIGVNEALTTSNLTSDGTGGLNDLQSQVTSLNSKMPYFVSKTFVSTVLGSLTQSSKKIGTLNGLFGIPSNAKVASITAYNVGTSKNTVVVFTVFNGDVYAASTNSESISVLTSFIMSIFYYL